MPKHPPVKQSRVDRAKQQAIPERRAEAQTKTQPEDVLGEVYLYAILDNLPTILGGVAKNLDNEGLKSDTLSGWVAHHGLMVISNACFSCFLVLNADLLHFR